MNLIIQIAKENNRDYITPEDISEAILRYPNINDIRLDLLEILGKQTEFGAEDSILCAFIAWRGKEIE